MYIRDDVLQKYKVGHHASFGSRWMLYVGDISSVTTKSEDVTE